MAQNKKLLIGGIILVLLVLVGGGYYMFSNNKPAVPTQQVVQQVQEDAVPSIKPADLGLTFTARSDGKAVKFVITNIKDITSVDYEISYTAKGDIPRGAIGHVEAKAGDSQIATNYIDLGTCSSGKCKYDEGVTSVKLVLKITKADGKNYSSEQTLSL